MGDIDQEILDLESSGSTLETVDSAVMAMQTVCGIALAEPTLGGEIGCGLASGMRGLTKLAILAQGVTTAQLIEDYRLDYEETNDNVESLDALLSRLRRLLPDPQATGDHTTYKRDNEGDINGYVEWKQNPLNPSGFDEGKRVDVDGKSHGGVSTPHVHEGGEVRPAEPEEIPNN